MSKNVDNVAVAVVTKAKKRIKKTECENERMSGRKGDRHRERERERERERDREIIFLRRHHLHVFQEILVVF